MEHRSVPYELDLATERDIFLNTKNEQNKRKEPILHYIEAEPLPDKHMLADPDDELAKDGQMSGGSSELSLPMPPDGGWGWVVCAASFVCMVIMDGILFSFGVFFLDLLEYFGEGKGKTAWVGSTLMGTHLIVGPFTSTLVNLWGIRRVAVLGTFIASSAFAISVIAPNIDVLILTYGIMGGIGVSMVYLPAVLIVGFYFEKRRARANGIACSGSGVGVFLYAPLTRYLQDEYTWRGALLILSAITLHCLLCAAMFRPLESKKMSRRPVSVTSSSSNDDEKELIDQKLLQHNVSNISKSKSQGDIAVPKLIVTPPGNGYCKSMIHMGRKDSIEPPSKCQSISSMPGISKVMSSTPNLARRIINKDVFQKPLYRKDIFYSGSIWNLPEFQKNPEKMYYSESVLRIPELSSSDETAHNDRMCTDFMYTAQSLMGIGLLKSPTFIICVFMSVMWTTHASVLTILPDYAVLSGINKQSAGMLLSVIGIANTLGRIGAGWLADRPHISVLWINGAALFVGSLTNIAIPFTTDYYLLMAEATVFGLCMATWTSLRPIVLVELLGLERLTNAFGLLAMFQGLAFCFGSPIAGCLFDLTQSYTVPFLCSAGAFMLSCLSCVPMRRIAKWENLNADSLNMDLNV